MSKTLLPAARATMLGPSQGESFNIIGGGLRVLADGSSTGGRCVMFECPIPAGEGPPLHTHEHEDEYFYVIDGRFKFSVDGRVFIGERGAFALAPRGSVHSFKNVGKTMGLLQVTCAPAGIEEVFRAIRIPEASSGQAAPSMEQIVAELGKHGIAFVGPPLEG